MDQQLSQVLVAVLADAHQPRLAAGCPLPGNQTEPCRQVAPMRESLGLADGRDQRRGVHDADPRDCGQSPRVFIFFGKRRKLGLESGDPPIELPPLRLHVGDQHPHPRGQGAALVFSHQHDEIMFEFALALRHDNPTFQQDCAQLVDQSGSFANQAIPGPVQRLHIKLRRGLDEPIVNQHIATITDLDAKIAAQCIALSEQREQIQSRTGPKRIAPN